MQVEIGSIKSLIEDGYIDYQMLRAKASSLTSFQRSVVEAFWKRGNGQMKMTYVQMFGYYPGYTEGPHNLVVMQSEVDDMVKDGLLEFKEGKSVGHSRYSLTFLGLLIMFAEFGGVEVASQPARPSSSKRSSLIELYDSMTEEQLFESTQPPRPGRVLPPDSVLKRLDPNRVTGWMNAKGYDYDDELMDKLYDLDDFEGVSE